MTREEQMKEAAERYAEEVKESFTGSDEDKHQERLVTINDFVAGWQEADSNPAWVSVEERLPKPDIFPEGKTFPSVLVCLTDGYIDTDAYDTDNKEWCEYDGEVEYWMPLPTPPVKKGGNDAR